jgi:hypothetical protein
MSILREIMLAQRNFSADNGFEPERIFVPHARAEELVDALSELTCGGLPIRNATGVLRVCGMALHFGGDRIEARAAELVGFTFA